MTETTPAPKKSHTLRNVLLVIALLGVLIVGGCFAVLGLAVNEADKAIKENSNKSGGDANPMEIEPGKGFEVDGFVYADGWKVGKEFGSINVTGLRVTNEREDSDSALVEIKFWRGQEVLALADCTTEPIQPGTTTKVDCISADKLPKNYDRITINDSF